jgi:hypothetical protein
MAAGEPPPPLPCTVVDNGSGTVTLPPVGCDYLSPDEVHEIIDGLPDGTTIELAAIHQDFICHEQGTIDPVCSFMPPFPGVDCTQPGGSFPGGEQECAGSTLALDLTGTGALAGFERQIDIPIGFETHTGPRTPGDPVQSFDTDMFRLFGQITNPGSGDPDFDLLRIVAGTDFGLPSPGHTTLTRIGPPGGNFAVDSFFDITYRIDFVGAPGGALGGMSGSTTGTIRMQTPTQTCPPIPAGTDIFPSTAKLVVQSFFGPGSEPFVVRLSDVGLGPTVVTRAPQVGDVIDVELVQLQLQGNHPQLGHVIARAGSDFGLPPSVGQITGVEQGPDCDLALADSFFDIFVELTLPDLNETWVNPQPLRVERNGLRRLPPSDEPYENPFVQPVLLVNQADGDPRAQVLYEVHHADPPPPDPGTDCLDTVLNLRFDFPPLGLINYPLTASGPTMVQRGAAFPLITGTCCAGGQSCGSDADCGLDDTCCQTSAIQTEMTQMQLTGFDPLLGEFQVRESPTLPSQGQAITIHPDSTYAVDSFFDVFVEISLADLGQTFSNQQPVHVQASGFSGLQGAANIPPDPGSHFQSPPGQTYPLQPGGAIRDIDHVTGPPEDWTPPPPADDDCLNSVIHLRITIFNPFCQEDLFIPSEFRIMRDDPQDPGGVGNELIDTLMAKGLIDFDSGCVGPVLGQVSATDASLGVVRGLAPAEFFPSDSFFDVFLELDSGIGPLHAGPAHMTTTINNLPPDGGEIYYGPGTVIPLFDEDGTQIGEILEVSHEIGFPRECDRTCYSTIRIGEVVLGPPPPGPLDPKDWIDVGIPRGAAGVTYDVVRGSLDHMNDNDGDMSSAVCLQDDGPRRIIDSTVPAAGEGFFYVARDGFRAFVGTWNSKGNQQVDDRDVKISVCSP